MENEIPMELIEREPPRDGTPDFRKPINFRTLVIWTVAITGWGAFAWTQGWLPRK